MGELGVDVTPDADVLFEPVRELTLVDHVERQSWM